MSKDDGGPAYPARAVPLTDFGGNDVTSGMSLRDYFAGQALAGIISSPSIIKRNGGEVRGESNIAATAYDFADAMLAARKGEGDV